VMLSVGFSEECAPQRFCHSAGSDAIHAIGVMARILTCDPDGPPPLKQWQEQRLKQERSDGGLKPLS
jgi:hypothetical protein